MSAKPATSPEREELQKLQDARLCALLQANIPNNAFYVRKFSAANVNVKALKGVADLSRLPFTTKAELLSNQEQYPPYGDNHAVPLTEYRRMHQTSGTAGRPIRWLDSETSWNGLIHCWQVIFEVVGIGGDDRLFFPFSFGPFLGFWTAFEAATRKGQMCFAGGGMSSIARLRFINDNQVSVVLCTPTYALHLAEVAQKEGIDIAHSPVRMLIVAGEPGGSVAATRRQIEQAWQARVFDHSGMTEVGPVSIECPDNPGGLHILETEYIAEIVDPETTAPAPLGTTGELVLTNLCRADSPLIRYRTGDLVRTDTEWCPCGRPWLRLNGGILGRSDEMIHVRGNNVNPSALEGLIRRFPEVAEFRLTLDQSRPLAALQIDLELAEQSNAIEVVDRVDRAIREAFLFRADVKAVPPGSLPRFEMKARRFVRINAGEYPALMSRTK